MVSACCSFGCTNRAGSSGESFHCIPANPERRALWLKAINRLAPDGKNPWMPSKYDRLCSAHFKEKDFLLSKHAKHRILREDAVPSVFSWKRETSIHSRTTKTNSNAVTESTCMQSVEMEERLNNKGAVKDHSYSFECSRQELKRKSEQTVKTLKDKTKKLKNNKQKEKKAKFTTESLLKEVKGLKLLSEQATEILESYKDIPVELFSKPPNEYTDEQKQFSSALYFYGPKAYSYLREMMNLPHPSTIQRWLCKIDSQPGFSHQVFEMLREKKKADGYSYTYCSVMVGAMSIRKCIDWDPKHKQMFGFVDLGSGSLDSEVSQAREALVILAVGLTGHWKVPIGYFFIDGVSAEVQSRLILTALGLLYDVGLRAVSVVMDGHSTDHKIAAHLDCILDPDNLSSHFKHPSNQTLNVYVFFDACHVLKNLRVALHSLHEVNEETFGKACWNDIARLEKLQSDNGLRTANKSTPTQMNVKLAAQTLSSSVAKALEFASLSGCSGFENCQGTINLISMVDHLFDIFNSRTPTLKGYKGPIRQSNFDDIREFLQRVRSVLLNLKDMTDERVCKGKRKILVIGFALNITSLIGLCDDLLFGTNGCLKLNYFLTYKLSQDHLELLFSAIRNHGGWNNNPSAAQFSSAYRSLFGHAEILPCESFSTDSVPQDVTSILQVNN